MLRVLRVAYLAGWTARHPPPKCIIPFPSRNDMSRLSKRRQRRCTFTRVVLIAPAWQLRNPPAQPAWPAALPGSAHTHYRKVYFSG